MIKKKIGIILGACILGISLPAIAMAETSSRRANIKSTGNIDFEDGEVYISSSDLTYLADEIDNLEDTYKQTTVDSLNSIGTYFLSDGSVVNDISQNEVDTDEEKVALSFGKITDGIRNSQSIESLSQTQATDKDGNLLFYETEEAQTNKDIYSLTTTDTGLPAFYQAANANNLSAGTAAWVDGTLIKGNGSDNAAYYAQGVIDGMEQTLSNLQVSYTYHEHEGSAGTTANGCYTLPIYHSHTGSSTSGTGCYTTLVSSAPVYGDHVVYESNINSYSCRLCNVALKYMNEANYQWVVTSAWGQPCGSNVSYAYTYGLSCNMTTSTITDYVLGCGKTEDTIESATILF